MGLFEQWNKAQAIRIKEKKRRADELYQRQQISLEQVRKEQEELFRQQHQFYKNAMPSLKFNSGGTVTAYSEPQNPPEQNLQEQKKEETAGKPYDPSFSWTTAYTTPKQSMFVYDRQEMDIINEGLNEMLVLTDNNNDSELLINAVTTCDQLARAEFERVFDRNYDECYADNPEKSAESFLSFYDYYYDILFSNRVKPAIDVQSKISVQGILESRRSSGVRKPEQGQEKSSNSYL